jgi:inorganic phosphate transporter, PiT family
MWLRGILTVTCAGVSFAHGSNDGQKTIGIFMLILMSLAPAVFAMNPELTPRELTGAREAARQLDARLGARGDAASATARADILIVTGAATASAGDADRRQVGEWSTALLRVTEYAPTWVLAISAICLGIGTMVGWKRVVVTVGEKIGKSDLTPPRVARPRWWPWPPSHWPMTGGCR